MPKKAPTREEMKAQRKAMLTPRTENIQFFFLATSRKTNEVFTTSFSTETEEQARTNFGRCYDADIIRVREKKAFTKREISNEQKKHG